MTNQPTSPEFPPPDRPSFPLGQPQQQLNTQAWSSNAIVIPNIFTLYFGFSWNWNWQCNVVQLITQRVDNSRVLVNQNPMQDEIDALVMYATRSLYEKLVGAPLGVALAVARLYSHVAVFLEQVDQGRVGFGGRVSHVYQLGLNL